MKQFLEGSRIHFVNVADKTIIDCRVNAFVRLKNGSVGAGYPDSRARDPLRLETGHDILIYITGIYHGYYPECFRISDPAPVYKPLFDTHLFGELGRELAATMHEDLFSCELHEFRHKRSEFYLIVDNVSADFYDQ